MTSTTRKKWCEEPIAIVLNVRESVGSRKGNALELSINFYESCRKGYRWKRG